MFPPASTGLLDPVKPEGQVPQNTGPSPSMGRRATDHAAPVRALGDRRTDTVSSGVVSEKRAERQFVRINLPMEVRAAEKTFKGRDFSLDGFSFDGRVDGQEPGDEGEFELRILFRGYTLNIDVKGGLVRYDERLGFSSYRIVSVGEDQLDIMRRLIRAYLSGQLVTFDGFILSNDMQTRRARSAPQGNVNKPTWRTQLRVWRRRLTNLTVVGMALMAVAVLLLAVIERWAVTEASIAATTAPQITLRAPQAGRISAHDWLTDDQIFRDDFILAIDDATLSAEIGLSRQALSAPGGAQIPSLQEQRGLAGIGRLALPDPLIKRDAILRSGAFGAGGEYERIRLAALELIAAENRFHAPCDCQIASIRRPGDWVESGEIVAVLAETHPARLRVDAIVEQKLAAQLQRGDRALGVLTGEQHSILADANKDVDPWIGLTVEAVSVGLPGDQRLGMPSLSHGFVHVSLHADEPLPANAIGRPLTVRFSDLTSISEINAHIGRELRQVWQAMAAYLRQVPTTPQ